MTQPMVDVVIPTIGRPTLATLLGRLAAGHPCLGTVVVVDDRRDRSEPLAVPDDVGDEIDVVVVAGRARGPAAARNIGWRRSAAPWVAFLDDDVEPPPDWLDALVADLCAAAPEVGAVQGRVEVPRPPDRRPTDWERNVAALEDARWVTADLAVRRAALQLADGFDERFTRAYREDIDLALRLDDHGWRLEMGRRRVRHPVRPAGRWISVALQANNGADPLMAATHGRGWRRRMGIPHGRRRRHLIVVGLLGAGIGAVVTGHRRAAAVAGLAWSLSTAEFAWARIAPGPRTAEEIATMVATSAVIPPVAVFHWLAGWVRLARGPGRVGSRRPGYPAAVFFDRDGTLVEDVPYNGDPTRVKVVGDVPAALERLRANGVPVGLISNQSGIARGLLSTEQVEAVNRELERVVGPFDVVRFCPHDVEDSCSCRKPAPGMVQAAARDLEVEVSQCVLVGDIASDVDAAVAAGARGILVPTAATRVDEVRSAREVAGSVSEAVDLVLGGGR